MLYLFPFQCCTQLSPSVLWSNFLPSIALSPCGRLVSRTASPTSETTSNPWTMCRSWSRSSLTPPQRRSRTCLPFTKKTTSARWLLACRTGAWVCSAFGDNGVYVRVTAEKRGHLQDVEDVGISQECVRSGDVSGMCVQLVSAGRAGGLSNGNKFASVSEQHSHSSRAETDFAFDVLFVRYKGLR